MMTRFKIPLLLQCLIFLIPLNFYIVGDLILVNAQWALFRYQQFSLGNSLILGYQDIIYIQKGLSTGLYNIAATLFWTAGAVILLIGLIISLVAYTQKESEKMTTASYFTLAGGIFLGLSAIFRFNGGFAIPVGVPVILVTGWWMYRLAEESDESEESEEIDDDADEVVPGPE